ncbi:hypothetical protein PtA15_3A262 [Puccinia triticina]|uniref:Uncharacterized protein n=1 Tax=Puccinia triticina TaxID=208348 RepID=A0ABY7CEI8_9BASI|nr:uncharacterized protein PtA15_3A262 [Puccinia triticina]WAQ82897.1 hypothetical protein PtA15_3A262 [Puccinia triticina]WAR53724.1 hypothetical protein PtB15_3B233 [Puccinia triticina]
MALPWEGQHELGSLIGLCEVFGTTPRQAAHRAKDSDVGEVGGQQSTPSAAGPPPETCAQFAAAASPDSFPPIESSNLLNPFGPNIRWSPRPETRTH